MNNLKFRVIENVDYDLLNSTYDATPYKTKEWAHFLLLSQGVHPYIVEIADGANVLGFLYAQKIKKFGIPMIVSPFEGWTTAFQGLSMLQEISKADRVEIYRQLSTWLFKSGHCLFFQFIDWQLTIPDVEGIFHYERKFGYRMDLTQDFETVIYKNFKEKSAKYSIKKARKHGVTIKHATDAVLFTEHYYEQLIEVFDKQGLKPTYSKQRILDLCNSLRIDDQLLLLEAYLPDSDECIATGLFLHHPKMAIYYGAASKHEYQKLCPNELLMYEAIKWLHDKGTLEMEFGGGRKYKEKYGPIPFYMPKVVLAKYGFIIIAKNMAKSLYYGVREFIANIKLCFRKK